MLVRFTLPDDNSIKCPICSAPRGEGCKTPKGRRAASSHAGRFRLWWVAYHDLARLWEKGKVMIEEDELNAWDGVVMIDEDRRDWVFEYKCGFDVG